MPENARKSLSEDFVRTPHTPEEARAQVEALKKRGVDAIKAVMEAGGPGMLFNRMDASILNAIVSAAHDRRLPVAVHTGSPEDIADAIRAGADSVEHGSIRQVVPDGLFGQMKQRGMAYDPTLTVYEAVLAMRSGKTEPLERSLVQQVAPPKLLAGTRKFIERSETKEAGPSLEIANRNLLAAYRNGVVLVTGSDAGNPMVIHGPTVHREMQLWVQAGIPAVVALQAATSNAARLLGAGERMGAIRKGYEATFLLVDGDPTKDIAATERISALFFKGERIRRQDLFDDESK